MIAQEESIRRRLLALLARWWWAVLIALVAVLFATGVPILKYLLYSVAGIFALIVFADLLFRLLSPALLFISTLSEHLAESRGQSFGRRFVFVPATLLATALFVAAQMVLWGWVLIVSLVIWSSVVGMFWSVVAFFFGLAPIGIVAAPFVMWIKGGFAMFLSTAIFFASVLFWNGLLRLAFSDDYWERTPEDFLGYSPHVFLLGALSLQVLALPFYRFGLFNVGTVLSSAGGAFFLLLALVSGLRWLVTKRRLPEDERDYLYKPSAWVYLFGLLLTTLLYFEFDSRYDAPTGILFWLNGFFFIALLNLGILRKRKNLVQEVNAPNDDYEDLVASDLMIMDDRCEAYTARGTRCKQRVQPGSRYCWRHQQ